MVEEHNSGVNGEVANDSVPVSGRNYIQIRKGKDDWKELRLG